VHAVLSHWDNQLLAKDPMPHGIPKNVAKLVDISVVQKQPLTSKVAEQVQLHGHLCHCLPSAYVTAGM